MVTADRLLLSMLSLFLGHLPHLTQNSNTYHLVQQEKM